jgi:hypothetical protein
MTADEGSSAGRLLVLLIVVAVILGIIAGAWLFGVLTGTSG